MSPRRSPRPPKPATVRVQGDTTHSGHRSKPRRSRRGKRYSDDVWIGDVVSAWKKLAASTPEQRKVIAEALGFEYTPPAPVVRQAPIEPTPVVLTPAPAQQPLAARDERGAAPVPPPSRSPTRLPLAIVDSRPAPADTPAPAWLRIDHPLEREALEHLARRPVFEPLFRPFWTRAILSAACATTAEDGPIAVERLVDIIAQGRPITQVPRERVSTLRAGMQLLADRGENLMPFARDVRDLVQQLLAVVGRDRTQVLNFVDCPELGAGARGRSSWRLPYATPPPGTPIVVLTDFGIARGSAGRSSVTDELWIRFLDRARAAGCPVVAFVPYPLDRWPPRLLTRLRAVPWDRPTTVSLVPRGVREGGRP